MSLHGIQKFISKSGYIVFEGRLETLRKLWDDSLLHMFISKGNSWCLQGDTRLSKSTSSRKQLSGLIVQGNIPHHAGKGMVAGVSVAAGTCNVICYILVVVVNRELGQEVELPYNSPHFLQGGATS